MLLREPRERESRRRQQPAANKHKFSPLQTQKSCFLQSLEVVVQ
jgi:hypothetical protein